MADQRDIRHRSGRSVREVSNEIVRLQGEQSQMNARYLNRIAELQRELERVRLADQGLQQTEMF